MEFGVIGAILYIGLFARLLNFISVQPSVTARRLAVGSLLAALSAAALTYSLWQGWWLGLLFLIATLMRMIFVLYAEPLTPEITVARGVAVATPDPVIS